MGAIMKKNKINGFTLVELLAVIVVLALIMIITIPTVLDTLNITKKGTLAEFATKSVNAAQKEKVNKDLKGLSEPAGCHIYDIETDLGMSSTGNYKGWVLFDPVAKEYYITVHDNDNMIVGLNYTRNAKNISDHIEVLNKDDERLAMNYLCGRSINCNACSYISNGVETPIDNVSYTGEAAYLTKGSNINEIWKTLSGDGTTSSSANNTITSIVYTTNTPPADAVKINNAGQDVYTWFDNGTIYYSSNANEIYLAADSSNLFCGLKNVQVIDLSHINTKNVTNMGGMFRECYSLSSIDLSKFNTSNVTNMAIMFSYTGLTHLDLTNFNTSNITNMGGMFYGSNLLTYLDVTGWDTSKVQSFNSWLTGTSSLTTLKGVKNFNMISCEDVSGMFSQTGLTSVDISGWTNTSGIREWAGLFEESKNIASINFGNINTSGAYDMSAMFLECDALVTLDISSFDTRNVKYFGNRKLYDNKWELVYNSIVTGSEYGTGMFSYCDNLTTIYVGPNFVVGATEATSNYMFTGSTKLKGACSYKSNKQSQIYANASTGYFKLKS